MTDVLLKPAFQSTFPDSGDVTKFGPTAWNAARLFSAGSVGDLLLRDTASATGASWLPDVAVGRVLVSGGVGVAPAWSASPALTGLTLVTPLDAPSGGTGQSGYAVGDLLYASTTTALSKRAAVAVGQVLVSAGINTAPAWSATPTVTTLAAATSITQGGALNLAAVSTDGIVLQNTTAATAGVPVQQSPRVRLLAHVWNTTPTAADNTDEWFVEGVPASAAFPAGNLKFGNAKNGAAATYPLIVGTILGLSPGTDATWDIGDSTHRYRDLYISRNYWGSGSIGFLSGARINGVADAQVNVTNNAQGAGVGFDVATDATLKIRTRAQSGYATVDALGYSVSGVAGASKAAGPVTSITVVNGLVTAIS